MINIDLRRESPQNNVNRILALESLIKYYPLSVVEEVDKRCIIEWIEEGENRQDVTFKQIDMAFVIFGLPTPELKHLMEKIEKRMRAILEEQKKNLSPEELEKLKSEIKESLNSSTPEAPSLVKEEPQLSNRERLALEAKQRLEDHYNGIIIEGDKKESLDKDQPEKKPDEAKVIQLNTNLNTKQTDL